MARDAVGGRLKALRGTLQLTQREVSRRINMPLPSYKDYENGNRMPGCEALGMFVQAGINANWLITGEGPMLLSEMAEGEATQPPDWQMLGWIIGEIEARSRHCPLSLEPDKKAQLIGLMYDYCCRTGSQDPALVDRFMALVGA